MSYREEAKERESSRVVTYVQPDLPAAATFATVYVSDMAQPREPKDIPCENCHKRPGFAWWTEGSVAFVHGMKWAWCEQCCVVAQLEAAYAASGRIAALEWRLEELRAEEPKE